MCCWLELEFSDSLGKLVVAAVEVNVICFIVCIVVAFVVALFVVVIFLLSSSPLPPPSHDRPDRMWPPQAFEIQITHVVLVCIENVNLTVELDSRKGDGVVRLCAQDAPLGPVPSSLPPQTRSQKPSP